MEEKKKKLWEKPDSVGGQLYSGVYEPDLQYL